MKSVLALFAACLVPVAVGAETVADVARRDAFNGVVLVSKGDTVTSEAAFGTADPAAPGTTFLPVWRWASITKQVIATLVMQEVAAGRIQLDAPVATYLPRFRSANASKMTVRQLLQHQSGLPNPVDTPPNAAGVPAYYDPAYTGSRDPLTGFCAGPVTGPPGGNWIYNNCDFVVAGALLEAVTKRPWQQLVEQRIARPLKLSTVRAFPRRDATQPGFEDGKPEAPQDLPGYGAGAALSGSVRDLWRFDRALMTGKLLPDSARAVMWNGDPKLGFMALGQWVFTVPVKGCAAPVRIVERRGAIGGVEVRNFILPDRDMVVIAFTNRLAFPFGEVWRGSGFSHDLLSAAVCP